MGAALLRHPDPDGAPVAVSIVSTGDAATPGCGFFKGSLLVSETIDNFNNSYIVGVGISGTTLATRFAAVRVFYRLQVSPAPATATFDDVPLGHPFRQFVEALFAAGITTGCSVAPPLYCPDNPVTRGSDGRVHRQGAGAALDPVGRGLTSAGRRRGPGTRPSRPG